MQFQLINNQGSEKKKARLQKELNNFVTHLQTLTTQSQHLLASLRSLSNKRQAEKIVRELKKS
jgi:DNA-binding transcriptional regulator GbsR (MarR family)